MANVRQIHPTPSTRTIITGMITDAIESRDRLKEEAEAHELIRVKHQRHPFLACVRWLCGGCVDPTVVPTDRTNVALDEMIEAKQQQTQQQTQEENEAAIYKMVNGDSSSDEAPHRRRRRSRPRRPVS